MKLWEYFLCAKNRKIMILFKNVFSEDEQRSYGFAMTWGWVINDSIFIFGGETIHQFKLKSIFHVHIHLFICRVENVHMPPFFLVDLWAWSPLLFLICHENIINFPMHAPMTSLADSNMSTFFITLVSSIILLKQSSQARENCFQRERCCKLAWLWKTNMSTIELRKLN